MDFPRTQNALILMFNYIWIQGIKRNNPKCQNVDKHIDYTLIHLIHLWQLYSTISTIRKQIGFMNYTLSSNLSFSLS